MEWTIRKTLLLVVFAFTIGMATVLIWMSARYHKATDQVMTRALASVTEELVHQYIWRYHNSNIKAFVDGWSIIPTLVNGITENDTEKLLITLDRMFSTLETKNKIVLLRDVNVYDGDMNLIVKSNRGIGEGLSEKPRVIERLNAQRPGLKRRGFNVLWQTSLGRPVLSSIAPIGGFRLLGFIEFVTDPTPALSGIAMPLGEQFALYDAQGDLLVMSNRGDELGYALPVDASTSDLTELSFTINGTEEEPWGYVTLWRDSFFVESILWNVRNQAISIVIILAGAGFLLAWLLLKISVFDKLSRFVEIIESLSMEKPSIDLPRTGADEFGDLRRALENLRDAVIARQELQRQSEIELEERRKVEKRLRAAMHELEKANLAKSEFLAHMSHELRTPLNAISGFAQIMSEEMFGDLGHEKYKEYASDVEMASAHLLSLVNDVLDLSKVESGEFEFNEEEIALDAMIDKCMGMIPRRNMDQSTRHVISEGARGLSLLGDSRLFRQILLNLLSNADKFTPVDGTVCVEQTFDDHGNLLIKVRDTGCGIEKSDLKKVMEPFGQARDNAQVAHEGTGLGLPISHKFMELHGGDLSIDSTVGEGTTATLRFPKERVKKTGESEEPAPAQRPVHLGINTQ